MKSTWSNIWFDNAYETDPESFSSIWIINVDNEHTSKTGI